MILTSAERQTSLETLLDLYQQYSKSTDDKEKQKIGDMMFFADPIIWVLYKHEAYKESFHPLLTWGDLIHHSFGHDGICGKRLHFIASWILKEKQVDILSEEVLGKVTDLLAVASSSLFLEISSNEGFMNLWSQHEYEKTGDKVTKWNSYTVNANHLQKMQKAVR